MEQTVYLGTTTTDVVIYTQAINSSGTHVALAVDTSTTKLVFSSGTQSSVVPTVTSLGTGKARVVFSSVTNSGNLTAGDTVAVKINGTADGVTFSEYIIPVFIATASSGGGTAPTEAQMYTYFTSSSREDAFKADVSSLALSSQVSALNDFNPLSQSVTVGTNNDKTGYSISGTKQTLDVLNDFNPATDTVANVTNTANVTNAVETDTASRNASKADVSGLSTFDSSTDQVVASNMRGTDGANTIAPDNAGITANNTAINNLNDLSSQDVENAVWDAPYANHTAANTFGKLMDILRKANRAIDAEVAGTPTASAFDTNLSGYADGAFDHELLVFVSGTLSGEARPIFSYSSTNGRITFEEPLTGVPSVSDEFIILPYHTTPTSEIQDGLVKVGQQFTYTNQAGDSHDVTIT